jgi:uncharacterized DUF497 family protein
MNTTKFKWDAAKNEWLKLNRGLSFEGVVAAIEDGKLLDDVEHPSAATSALWLWL